MKITRSNQAITRGVGCLCEGVLMRAKVWGKCGMLVDPLTTQIALKSAIVWNKYGIRHVSDPNIWSSEPPRTRTLNPLMKSHIVGFLLPACCNV